MKILIEDTEGHLDAASLQGCQHFRDGIEQPHLPDPVLLVELDDVGRRREVVSFQSIADSYVEL